MPPKKSKAKQEKKANFRRNSLEAKFLSRGLSVWIANPFDEEGNGAGYRSTFVSQDNSTKPLFIPACIAEVAQSGTDPDIRIETVNCHPNKSMVVKASSVYARNTKMDLDDMVYFSYLHEAAVLNNIMIRYLRRQIYTRAGEILIILNPYKLIRDKNDVSIYDPIYMARYRSSLSSIRSGLPSGTENLPPHVFSIADQAYVRMQSDRLSQSVVISGESGAGKTETTKQIMQFVANISSGLTKKSAGNVAEGRRRSMGRRGSLGGPENPFDIGGGGGGGGGGSGKESKDSLIERQLLQSNPILEAFGNAKTLRNNNSSRFGKYLKIFFSTEGKIIGGSMTHYLLEKSRVYSQLNGERSYHFFYQLLKGTDAGQKKLLELEDPSTYRFLADSGSDAIRDAYMGGLKSSDEADFAEVQGAMDVIGLAQADQMEMFRVVAAVLNMGNVRFDQEEDANSTSGYRATDAKSSSRLNLEKAARLLSVNVEDLREASVQRVVESHGDKRILVSDAPAANLALKTLASTLYVNLFGQLVLMINNGIRSSVKNVLGLDPNFESNPTNLFVGILDIFGFEVFDQGNGFEQLLINYANERLHNFFIKHFFKMEEIKYEQEGIDYSSIQFTDNQLVLDLIGKKPNGLFYQISNASLFGKLTDEKLLNNIATKLKKKKDKNGHPNANSHFVSGGFRDRMLFTVRHSANDVTYTCESFIEKNKDKLEPALEKLMSQSNSKLVRSLVAADDGGGGGGGGGGGSGKGGEQKKKKRSTLAGANVMLSLRFSNNISVLMKTMETTAPQFIRCVKSNECKKPFFFNSLKTFHQLQYLGVLDSIRIRHDGYSYQTSYKEFFAHFCIVATDPELSAKQLNNPTANFKILGEKLAKIMWSWNSSMFSKNITLESLCQFGHTKIFIRKQLSQSLEALREIKLEDMKRSAVLVQSVARMYFAKARIAHLFGGFLRLQAAWRSVFYRQQWLKRRNAILTVQWFSRGVMIRRKFLKVQRSASVINRFCNSTIQRIKWLRLRRGLRVLHSLSRGYVIRMHVIRMISAVRTLQTMARAFLRRTHEYWDKVKGALLFQAAWCDYKTRVEREDIVDYLALRREERVSESASRIIQGAWKTTLIRRRYKQIVAACHTLQNWNRAAQIRSRFLLVRRCTRAIQRIGRGSIARGRARDIRTTAMIADEMWRIKTIRERELLHIAKMNSNPHKLSQLGFQEGFTAGSYAKKNRGRVQYRFACLDVDTMVDDSEVYPRGVGPVLYDLMAELAPSNRRIRSIEAGANHIVALDSSGEIYTWGFGDRGQLGHSNFRSKIRPEKMASSAFSAAVTVDKVGKGGTNGSGRRQFSYSSGSPYSGTVRGALSHRVSIRQIACGEDHSVALTEEGAVFTWGDNSRGQLGHGDGTITNGSSGGNGGGGGGSRMAGTNEDCPQPRLVQGLLRRKVAEIAAGGHHTLALVVAGSLYTWGSGEQLGLGVYAGNGDMNAPQAVKTMAKFRLRHIDCGVDWSVALSHSGDVYTWGANHNGQLGVDDCRRRLVPTVIKSLRRGGDKHARIADVSCGGHHAVCVSSTGRVHVWGRNNHGQLGLGDRDDRSSPQMLHRLRKHRIMQVAGGWRHTIVLTDESTMFAWGMFSAVTHIYPRAMHDPDSDNTQFETHIPLEIPFNPSNVNTSIHSSSKNSTRNGRGGGGGGGGGGKKKNEVNRASMPALRSIQGIACTSSRTLSLTTIQWQQKPGPEAMLRQPLLQHSLAVQTNQADNLLLDHKEHEPGFAYNLERAQKSSKEDGSTDQELMMATTAMRRFSTHGHPLPPAHVPANPFGDDVDPYGVDPVELQSMDTAQLRQLVLSLQRNTPAAFSGGGVPPAVMMRSSRIGMKQGLRMNASSSPVIQENRREMESERTLMETQQRFQYRDLPQEELTPTQDAKRRGWNGYHTGKLMNSKKKNLQLGPNAPDHKGRMTSPERTHAMEHALRAELLQFDSKEGARHSPPGKKKKTLALEGLKSSPMLTTKSFQEKRDRELLRQEMDRQRKVVDEQERRARVWDQRVQREGYIRSTGLMDLFTPEQLVATSNDDLDVADIIDMVHRRGGVPTLPPSQYSSTAKRSDQQQQYKKGKNSSSNSNSNSSSSSPSKKYLTTHGALNNIKAGLRGMDGRQDSSTSKRDIVGTFRERERINQLPTFSSTPGEIQIGDQRRREIEADILGTPNQPKTKAVPATSLIHQQAIARHRGHMASMGDVGAYSHEAEEQPSLGLGLSASPPPPAPDATSELPLTSSPRNNNQMETKSEIQLMREKLEHLKRQNAFLSSEEPIPPPPAPPTDAPPGVAASNFGSPRPPSPDNNDDNGDAPAPAPAPAASPSSALAEKIARIKAKATEDLEQLWMSDTTKAKSVPLPTDHGVNNNRKKITSKMNPIRTPVPQVVATPSLSEMLRRKSTAFDGSQTFEAADFQ